MRMIQAAESAAAAAQAATQAVAAVIPVTAADVHTCRISLAFTFLYAS